LTLGISDCVFTRLFENTRGAKHRNDLRLR
jgi:hypothetical protein